jgi:O-antigen ligase
MIIALLGVPLGIIGSYASIVIIGICMMGIILLLGQIELAAGYILIIHLYVDWYLGQAIVAQMLTFVLLVILFLTRSPQRPWGQPCVLWLWMMLLMLGIIPAIRGALIRYDAAFYYPNIILGALLMLWLGTVIARDTTCVRRFFKTIAAIAALLSIITIFQSWTGILLFGSSHFDSYLVKASNFNIFPGSDVYRLGSFLVNPDWNGAFFAMLLCIPLGLFVESTLFAAKTLYLLEALIILPALLFTYSVGSWVSAGVAIVTFILLAGYMRHRAWIVLFLIVAVAIFYLFFKQQLLLLYKHASDPSVLMLRDGAWKTAINVMHALPLTGTGLGSHAYMLRAEPYRVSEQYKILAHPHNSYLELGAMGGLPVLVTFVALILFTLWRALNNWFQVDIQQRTLLSGGIAAVIALSINSLSVNAWTLPPLAAFGWLIFGVISSPLLTKGQKASNEFEQAR